MVIDISITILFGIFTFSSLLITLSLGIAIHRFHKPVFKYHGFFAYLTFIIALIHAYLVISLR